MPAPIVIKLNKTSRIDLMKLLALEISALYTNVKLEIHFWGGKDKKPNVNVSCNKLDSIISKKRKEKMLLAACEKAKKIYHSGDFRTWNKLLTKQMRDSYGRFHDSDNINFLKKISKDNKLTTLDYVTLMIAELETDKYSLTHEEKDNFPSVKIESYTLKVCNEIDKRILEAILFQRITTKEEFYKKIKSDVVNYINKIILETRRVSNEK